MGTEGVSFWRLVANREDTSGKCKQRKNLLGSFEMLRRSKGEEKKLCNSSGSWQPEQFSRMGGAPLGEFPDFCCFQAYIQLTIQKVLDGSSMAGHLVPAPLLLSPAIQFMPPSNIY